MSNKIFLPAVTFVAGLLLLIVWHQFFYTTTQQEILSMQLETRRLREVERELNELKARHENLSDFVAEKDQQLDAARNFFPATLEQEKFIDELYRAADFNKVHLTSVQTSDANSADEIQSQVISVELEGDYISLLNFLRETLDGGRLVSLENFSVEKMSGSVLSCDVSLKIFAAP
ncbi:MAG: type 4a pilus biogenesis protein PilO [Selenomonadaceae bacterium]|nr:type 4a pilus biogenesis protein PilO [Selenomonadaceae bacterium]